MWTTDRHDVDGLGAWPEAADAGPADAATTARATATAQRSRRGKHGRASYREPVRAHPGTESSPSTRPRRRRTRSTTTPWPRQYGFRGGLVPGVDVYAYMTHVPAETWGRAWLEDGSISARFVAPVYDGEEVDVVATEGPEGLELTVTGSDGSTRATGRAALGAGRSDRPEPDHGELPDVRPPASPDSLRPGTVLGSIADVFSAQRATPYLADVRESLPLYADRGRRPPGLAAAVRQHRAQPQRRARPVDPRLVRRRPAAASSRTARPWRRRAVVLDERRAIRPPVRHARRRHIRRWSLRAARHAHRDPHATPHVILSDSHLAC